MSRLMLALLLGLGLAGSARAMTEVQPQTPQQTDNLVDPDEKSEFGAEAAPSTSYPENRTRSQYLLGEPATQNNNYNSGHLGNFSFGFSQQSGTDSPYRR